MAIQMTKFCYCISLKFGFIILSSLFFIGGTIATVKYSLDITIGENLFRYAKGSTVSLAALYSFLAVGGLFGLFIVTCMNTSKMLSDYSKLEFGFIGLNIFFHIKSIIEIVLCKSAIITECVKSIYNKNDRDSHQIEHLIDVCNEKYDDGLIIIISLGVISILLLVYFCMVIISYAQQRKDDEFVTGPSGHNRVVPMVSNRPNNIPNANVANAANAANAANTNASANANANAANASDGSNAV